MKGKGSFTTQKSIVSLLTMLLLICQLQGVSAAEEDYIAGPWLWMIAKGSDINRDHLSKISNGDITENHVSTYGVNEGDSIGGLQWTRGEILPTTECKTNVTRVLGFDVTTTTCSANNVNEVVNAIGLSEDRDLNHCSAYALINIISPRDQEDVRMGVGSDDSIKVWLNGEIVHTNDQAGTGGRIRIRSGVINGQVVEDVDEVIGKGRSTSGIQDRFSTSLKSGNNLLLVKVSDFTGHWGMFFKIYDTDYTTSIPIIQMSDTSDVIFPDVNGDGVVNTQDLVAKESLSASAVSPLTETTLKGSTVTLTLTGATYEQDITTIREAVKVSGITGVTLDTETIQRISDTEITVKLNFDYTNFDTDTALTFSVASGAIADYTGDDFTTEVPVTAVADRVEISVSTSVLSRLTEASLNKNVVTLVLAGAAYDQDIGKIRDAVTVSGIDGVTIASSKIQRLSDREVTVELSFDGTDFDENGTLTFSVASGAIANYTRDAFTVELAVTAHKESVSASVVSPLTEATLNGGTVELTLTAATYEQDISKIKEAVTVSGITGVTINSSNIQRLSDREITVELGFDGTDFVRDIALIFSVDAGAITNHKGSTLTTETLVTANRDEVLLKMYWTDYGTDKVQRANLDGSNVEDLVTTGLDSPRGIALDVVGGKMYWTDGSSSYRGTDKIQRANLDGSNVEDLVTLRRSWRYLIGIALDVVGGKMYWIDYEGSSSSDMNKIQRANLDGSNIEDLVTFKGGSGSPNSIALDVVGGKMYWTDWGTEKIRRANLDGSNVEDLVTTGLDSPRGIALDVAGGKMYWADYEGSSSSDTNKIRRANLDGSNVEDLVTTGLDSPRGIALDVVGGKMYWTDYEGSYSFYTNKIQRANLDGSNIEDLVAFKGRSGSPSSIAIGIATPVNATTVKADVNRDGVVDVQDLAVVGLRYGKTGTTAADVNGDGVVNVDDFILVAAAVDSAAAAAPAARAKVESHFTEGQLQGWLTEARASGNTSRTYQRGIAVIEQLLTLFTPEKTTLLANYPNPFNPETWIPYQLAKSADVSLTIYDIRGVIIRELQLGHQRAGLYQSRSRAAYWDGRNAVGESVASGVYFYTLTAGEFSATRKMLIRK